MRRNAGPMTRHDPFAGSRAPYSGAAFQVIGRTRKPLPALAVFALGAVTGAALAVTALALGAGL